MVNNKKRAFSLIEAIIIMVVMAIAIVAMTPSITKKIVNKFEFGTSLTGNSHGRYEVFVKEIYDIQPIGLYEKTIDETKSDGIVLYERKTHPEIYNLTKGNNFYTYLQPDPEVKNFVYEQKDENAVLSQQIGYKDYRQVIDPNGSFGQLTQGYPTTFLYEEFRDVTPHRDSNGRVTHVTFHKDKVIDMGGSTVREDMGLITVPVGGRYVIENQNVVYRRGSFQDINGVKTWVLDDDLDDKRKNKCSAQINGEDAKDEYGTSYCSNPLSLDWRIIQGEITQQYRPLSDFKMDRKKQEDAGEKLDPNKWRNNFFVVNPKSYQRVGDANIVRGNVTYVLWERMYDGNKLVLDRQVPQIDGKAIAFFNPTNIVKNATIHAVGGGGAGGGIFNHNSNVIDLKKLSIADINGSDGINTPLEQIRSDLANRFRMLTNVNWTDDEIARVVNVQDLYKKPYNEIYNSDKNYIVLNLYDGTLNVKMDRRHAGKQVTPEQLLQYSHILGTSFQAAEKWRMPNWGINWKSNIVKGSTGNTFNQIIKIERISDEEFKAYCYSFGSDVNAETSTCEVDSSYMANAIAANLNIGSYKLYNHIYTWSVPYKLNSLRYGSAGEPGQYVNKVIPIMQNRIAIEIGKGGEWTEARCAIQFDGDKCKTKQGPSGTSTVIKTCKSSADNNCFSKSLEEYNEKFTDVLFTAPGGKGGRSDLLTDRYDLCWLNKEVNACTVANNVQTLESCCTGYGTHGNSAFINASSAKTSLFENIRALAGMSKVVGVGAGRSGQGIYSVSGHDIVEGDRIYVNSSNPKNYSSRLIDKDSYNVDVSKVGSTGSSFRKFFETGNYNLPAFPSPLYFKGEDGAVVITW